MVYGRFNKTFVTKLPYIFQNCRRRYKRYLLLLQHLIQATSNSPTSEANATIGRRKDLALTKPRPPTMAFLLAITAVPLLLIAVGSLAVLTSVGFNNARGMYGLR